MCLCDLQSEQRHIFCGQQHSVRYSQDTFLQPLEKSKVQARESWGQPSCYKLSFYGGSTTVKSLKLEKSPGNRNWIIYREMKTYQSELRSVEPIPPLRSEWRSVEVCRGKQEDKITFVSNWLILPPPWSIGCDPLSREVFIEFFFYKNAHLSCCTFDLNAAASLSDM